MDKKLQKNILKLFVGSKDLYILSEEKIIESINKLYFKNKKSIPYLSVARKQIQFLIDDSSLRKTEFNNNYRITEWGELRVEGGLKKLWYWLIYKNHNLISFIAVILSLVAIIVSLINIK